MTTINRQIFDKSLAHQSNVVDFSRNNADIQSNKLNSDHNVKELRDIILLFLASYNLDSSFKFVLKKDLKALDDVEAKIYKLRKTQYDDIESDVKKSIDSFISEEKKAQVDIIYGGWYDPKEPKDKLIEDVFLASMIMGATFNDNFRNNLRSDVDRILKTLRYGLSQNQKNSEILKSITGTKQNRYQDGQIKTSKDQLNSLIDSSFIGSQTSVISSLNQANARSLTMYGRFVAVLDSRTSIICQSLSGETGKYEDLPHPPLHWRCRSHIAPFFKSIPGVQKSQIGGIPRENDYMVWLKKQNYETQKAVLGVKRANLLRDKKLTLSDLYSKNNDLFLIKDLYKKYGNISTSIN